MEDVNAITRAILFLFPLSLILLAYSLGIFIECLHSPPRGTHIISPPAKSLCVECLCGYLSATQPRRLD